MQRHLKCCLAFGESTMSRTQIQLWYQRFKEGRGDANGNARSGRPSTSITNENMEAMKKMILHNRQITIREVTDDVGLSNNFYGCFKHETSGSETSKNNVAWISLRRC